MSHDSTTAAARLQEQFSRTWGDSAFMLFWVSCFVGIVLLEAGAILLGAIRQLNAFALPMTRGTIVTSELAEETDPRGKSTYEPKVKYAYTVNGKKYEGTRFRYHYSLLGKSSDQLTESSLGRSVAQDRLQGFPVGKQVPVYYEGAHPNQAILVRGLEPEDLFAAQCLIPFSLMGIGLGWMTLGKMWRKKRGGRPSNIRLTSDADNLKVAVYAITPLFGAGLAVLAVSFVLLFVVGFGLRVWPGWGLVSLSWLLILFSGGYTYRYLRQPSLFFARDLTTGQIAVQKWSRPPDAYHLGPGDVTGIDLRSSKQWGDKHTTSYQHQLKLNLTGRMPILLPASSSLADTEWLKTTLEEFFQVETPPAEK